MSRYAHDGFSGWLPCASFLDVRVTHLSDGKGLNFAYNVRNRRGMCHPAGRGDQGAPGDNVERVSRASRIAQQRSLGRGIPTESLYAVEILRRGSCSVDFLGAYHPFLCVARRTSIPLLDASSQPWG
uniref:Uncharacterized protein n=1 Tax=Photinus pyralis TaxID=7054 RepID=A0A1Y1M127_PHOPY